jgi:hypothetical protein
MLIFLGCCAVPQAPARSFGCIPATTQHLPLSERHSAVTFLLNCVSLPAQEHGHHTPNSITAHPFHELKTIFIKQISSPLLCQIAHRRWGGSGPKERSRRHRGASGPRTGNVELGLAILLRVEFCRRVGPGAMPCLLGQLPWECRCSHRQRSPDKGEQLSPCEQPGYRSNYRKERRYREEHDERNMQGCAVVSHPRSCVEHPPEQQEHNPVQRGSRATINRRMCQPSTSPLVVQ